MWFLKLRWISLHEEEWTYCAFSRDSRELRHGFFGKARVFLSWSLFTISMQGDQQFDRREMARPSPRTSGVSAHTALRSQYFPPAAYPGRDDMVRLPDELSNCASHFKRCYL